MAFLKKIYIALIILLTPIALGAQSYVMDSYQLNPSTKTWIQKISTFPKASSSAWSNPRVKPSGWMDGKASYAKFKKTFPELKTAEQYIAIATLFKTKRPRGTQKKFLKNKNLVQYHAPSNVFGAYDSKGKPITFFRPKEGQKYYDNIGKNPNYTFPGYVPYKSSSTSKSTASRSQNSSSTSKSNGSSSSSKSASNSSQSNTTEKHRHTREYFLKSYRPKPGVKTWLNSASKFSKKNTNAWHAKENISASNNAKEKYNKHRNAFPEIKSLTEYIAAAHQFKAKRPSGTLKKKMKNGDTVQYHEKTNVFAAYNPAGMPRTMFRPKAGILYYEDLESVKQIQYDGYGEQANPRLAGGGSSSSSSTNSGSTVTDSGEVIRSSKNYLVNLALQATSIENKLNRSLNSKKSWDAVKQVMLESKTISSTDSRSINASTQLVNSGDPLIKDWRSIPEGHLIGFFTPMSSSPIDVKGPAPGKKEKLIHLMISSGNGRAIGTGNKIIGIGDLRGWQELDLSSLRYDSQQKFFVKGQGRSATEVYVRTYDPKRGFRSRAIDNPTTNIGGVAGNEEKRTTGQNSSTTSAKKSSQQLLAEISKSSTNINTAENRLLNSKKARAAVEHVLKLSDQYGELDLRRLFRDLNTTPIATNIVDDISKLPAGYVLRFFRPSSHGVQQIKGHTFSKKVTEIHTMITTGNGKAIGTENKNIGIGSVRGWEELDLKKLLRYDRGLRYFELIKNNTRIEVYITFDNPFGNIDRKYKNEWDGSEGHLENRSLDDIVNEYEGDAKSDKNYNNDTSHSEYDIPEPPQNYDANDGVAHGQSNNNKTQGNKSTSNTRKSGSRLYNKYDDNDEPVLKTLADGTVIDDNTGRVISKGAGNNTNPARKNTDQISNNGYGALPDNSFIDINAGRKIADVAMELLNTNDPKKKAIGFKKSWEAIEHMLVLSDVISTAKAKKMIAIKELVEPSDPKAKRIQSLPPGALIGFFVPMPNGQERMIHSLVAIGNGKAVGTGNAAIGAGSAKGLEALDLATLNMSTNSTITKKQGSRTMEIIVRVNNPLELSDTKVYAYPDINDDDGYDVPNENSAVANNGDGYEVPDENSAVANSDDEYTEDYYGSAPGSLNGYTPGPQLANRNTYTPGPAGRSRIQEYELRNSSLTHVDPSIWGGPAKDIVQEFYLENKKHFPSINSIEQYVALAVQFYEQPPENSIYRTMANGDLLFYNDTYEIFAAYNKKGNPLNFISPNEKYWHFWRYAYEPVCNLNGVKSEALDTSPTPMGLNGATGKIYNTIPLPKNYDGENQGIGKTQKGNHVEYCSISERQALEVFVKNGLLVDRDGKPIDTRGASRALNNADPHMAIFVMDTNGRIYQFKYPFQAKFHHSSFLSGASIASAGEVRIYDGVLQKISARSGHYKPSVDIAKQIFEELQARGYSKKLPIMEPGL